MNIGTGRFSYPWRLRVDGPASGAENMEADEALLEAQKDPASVPVLRLFRWKHPVLSYGRLCDAHQAANQAMILSAREAVRRPTGGGAVFHDLCLSYSLAWNKDHASFPRSVKEVYRAIHETVREALSSIGVVASFHPGPSVAGGFCADAPATDDLMFQGKKIVGGAMRVTRWGRLYQGNVWAAEAKLKDNAAEAIADAFEKFFFKSAPARRPPTPSTK